MLKIIQKIVVKLQTVQMKVRLKNKQDQNIIQLVLLQITKMETLQVAPITERLMEKLLVELQENQRDT